MASFFVFVVCSVAWNIFFLFSCSFGRQLFTYILITFIFCTEVYTQICMNVTKQKNENEKNTIIFKLDTDHLVKIKVKLFV